MKKILLYTDSYGGRVGINDAYVNFAYQFGEVILVNAGNDLDFFVEHGDVLLLPGGADVDPHRYGERPHFTTGRSNPHYEYLDLHLLPKWIETGKPIIGICRGMQTLNVALGGSLYQDINGHVGNNDRRGDTPFELTTIIEGFEMHSTNSFHHQAVKELGQGLEVIGWAPAVDKCPSLYKHNKVRPIGRPNWELEEERKNGVKSYKRVSKNYYSHIEIIRHTTLPYIAFQYHPEEFNCPLAIQLISETLGVQTVEPTFNL